MKKVGITGYMVGAMDEEILVALARRKIHTFSMASGAPRRLGLRTARRPCVVAALAIDCLLCLLSVR